MSGTGAQGERRVEADAPGRVNLIGEHTDYHEGFVLPVALARRTHATLDARTDRLVRLTSEQRPEALTYALGTEARAGTWGDYVQGLTWALARQGREIGGFDLQVRSDVPAGSGLASSAALLVATLRAIRLAFDVRLTDLEIARLAHHAELEFVGAPVGIMDQMAASLAAVGEALFIDTRTLEYERIPLPAAMELVVIDSGISHRHATPQKRGQPPFFAKNGGCPLFSYGARRNESEEAARLLGVERLRDAGRTALDRLRELPPVAARRARHVITENDRVLAARTALLDGNVTRLGQLIRESHASLRDDYEVSTPELDLLVELASTQPGALGARLTGGGFGGAIIIAVEAGRGQQIAAGTCVEYARRTGRQASVVMP